MQCPSWNNFLKTWGFWKYFWLKFIADKKQQKRTSIPGTLKIYRNYKTIIVCVHFSHSLAGNIIIWPNRIHKVYLLPRSRLCVDIRKLSASIIIGSGCPMLRQLVTGQQSISANLRGHHSSSIYRTCTCLNNMISFWGHNCTSAEIIWQFWEISWRQLELCDSDSVRSVKPLPKIFK